MDAPLPPPVVATEPFPGQETLGAWWRGLEAQADARSFLAWPWVGAFLAETGLKPQVLTARAGERLVGLGLLVQGAERRHGGLVAPRVLFVNQAGDAAQDCVYPEYNGFLVDRDYGAALEARMLAHLAQATPCDEVRLAGVPARYLDHAQATGLAVHLRNDSGAAIVDLDAIRRSGQDYVAQLSGNRRYQLRRAQRHYAERGTLALEVALDVPAALAYLDGLVALHQRYWTGRGQPGAFGPPFALRFHRRLIAEALPMGAVELLCVRAGDEVVGYLYNLVWRGWVGAYASGFAYGDDPKATPGYVCYQLAIERHLALGSRVFDFLAGESRYKTSLGTPGERLVWFDLQQPRLMLTLESWARRWKAGVRSRATVQEE